MISLNPDLLWRSAVGKMCQPLAFLGWRLPLAGLISSSRPTVLLYHGVHRSGEGWGIDSESFERHIVFLQEKFEFVSPAEVGRRRGRFDRTQVLLTFDDGMRNNFEVARPILLKYRIPALFFISSRHAEPGQHLWFSYLRALEKHFPRNGFAFRGTHIDMRPGARTCTIAWLREFLLNLKPHPAAMYQAVREELPPLESFVTRQQLCDEYEGMTPEQVGELATNDLFSIGCHTMDHPYLSRCEPEEMCRQIQENKHWLEAVTGAGCNAIAYPLGDYNAAVVDMCRKLGFSQGYAVSARLRSFPEFEIPRIGIYSTSLEFLGLKAQWGNFMRAARVSVG